MSKYLTEKFTESLKRLNEEQRKAVETIEGAVMVVAGPGTGKTQILAMRIANILLKTDIEPQNILALTFTENGVMAMRKRLTEIIGSAGYYVNIFTFHSFCNDIIQSYPENFPEIVGAKSVTQLEQIDILEGIIKSESLDILRPFGDIFHNVKPILGQIGQLKKEGIGYLEFKEALKKEQDNFDRIEDLLHDKGAHKGKMKGKYKDWQKEIAKNNELAIVYERYEKTLRERRLYDFDDMIIFVIAILKKNEDFKMELQEKFQYILVDEHQDTNMGQNNVLSLLTDFYENPNLFIVGDEKQAIFSFQGASLANFHNFKEKYPLAELISLTKNYRSTQAILDSASSLIKNNSNRLSLNDSLISQSVHENYPLEIYEFKNPDSEKWFIGKKIEELSALGVHKEEIAVLYRNNADAFLIADVLARKGIPYIIESESDILGDSDIKKLIAILRLVADFSSDEKFISLLHIDFWGLPAIDIFKILKYQASSPDSVFELSGNKEKLEKAGISEVEKITKIHTLVSEWYLASKNGRLEDLLESIIRDSGFLKHTLLKADSFDALRRVNVFLGEFRKASLGDPDYSLADFVKYLDLMESQSLKIKEKRVRVSKGAVRLMTAHGSKGLEFEYVFIFDVVNGKWGSRRNMDKFKMPRSIISASDEINKEDDERRLFYVAITRAKKMVYISYSLVSSPLSGGGEQFPSKFIEEIHVDLRTVGDAEKYEDELAQNGAVLLEPHQVMPADIKEKEFVAELFYKRGFSVSHLNSYLTCPWRYFYVSLLRIPSAKSRSQIYGTAIHEALRALFDAVKAGEVIEKPEEFLVKVFREALELGGLNKEDFELCLRQGERALPAYYANWRDSFIWNTINEFDVRGVLLNDRLKLTGKLDKMEILNEEDEVNVVDYKTGKTKTRGELEGETKGSNGDYKRQLVFYALLLSLYRKFGDRKFKMVSGEIDFVEADKATGKFRKEKFLISNEEIEELKKKILEVENEIVNLKFWDKRCGEANCKYCALRNMIPNTKEQGGLF